MRASLIEAIKNVEAEDAPRFNDCVYVDPAGVVDALVEWLRQNADKEVSTRLVYDHFKFLRTHELADLLSEET